MKKKLEIFTETVYEVYNPWRAETLATFTRRRDAELFKRRWEEEHGDDDPYAP